MQRKHVWAESLEMRRLLSWTGAATDLYVSGQNSDTIYQVNPSTGAIIGAAPTNGDASGICFDDSSRLYVVDYTNMEVDEFNTSTGANLGKFASPFMLGYGLAYGDGQFFLADRAGSVDVYHSNGAQNVMILSDDPNYDPISALVTPSDKLLVGTYSGTQIDESNLDGSSPTVFVSNSLIGTGYGLAFGPNGNLYESNGAANKILEFDGSTGGYITSITGGGLDFPLGITFGPDGTLYVANNGNNTISTFNGTTGAAKSVFTGFGGVYAMAFQPAAFADHLVFSTEPSNTGAGQTIGGGGGVQVTIEDQSDQVVTSSDIINLSLGTNPTSATLGGTISATAINGVATFNNLSISKLASGYTLTATDTTTTSTASATSSAFNISAGSQTSVVFIRSPENLSAGATMGSGFGIEVELLDAYGNPTSSDTVQITLNASNGATLSGTSSVAATNGVATFSDLTVTRVGQYTLTANDVTTTGVTAATSNSFLVVAGAKSKLVFTNAPENTVAGQTLGGATGVVVFIEDSYGNVTGVNDSVQISIEQETASGILSGTTTVSAVNGVATFSNLSIAQSGGYILSAEDSNLTAATSALFSVYVPGVLQPAIQRSTIPAAVIAGVPLHRTVVVQVTNKSSQPVKGANTVNLYVSTAASYDSSAMLVTSVPMNAKLAANKATKIVVPVKTFPADLPAGAYHLFVNVINPTGNYLVTGAGPAVTVAAPVVTLAASVSAVKPNAIKVNQFGTLIVTVTNKGNVMSTFPLAITVQPSRDGSTPLSTTLTTANKRVVIQAGKSMRFTLRFKVTSALTAGSYQPYVTLLYGSTTLTAIGSAFLVA